MRATAASADAGFAGNRFATCEPFEACFARDATFTCAFGDEVFLAALRAVREGLLVPVRAIGIATVAGLA
jgi:hypothetical protein